MLVADVNETTTGILYYFGGYAGYFLLGYALLRYPALVRGRYVAVMTLAALAFPVVCKVAHWEVDFYRMFWYLSVFVAILCVAWFKVALRWGGRLLKGREWLRRIVVWVSNLSFGIYLVHFFILRNVLWHVDWIAQMQNYYIQTLVLTVLTTVLSATVCALLSLVPGSEYMIGYRFRRNKR